MMRPVLLACVIAGIHLDQISEAEIAAVVASCDSLVDELIRTLAGPDGAGHLPAP